MQKSMNIVLYTVQLQIHTHHVNIHVETHDTKPSSVDGIATSKLNKGAAMNGQYTPLYEWLINMAKLINKASIKLKVRLF